MPNVRAEWNKRAATKLVGRKIVAARYLTPSEAQASGWERCPIVLFLDDDTLLIPSSDDEGNDAGALFHSTARGQSLPGFPVLSSAM